MILTIDIGNSNIVFGVYGEDRLLFSSRVKTDPLRTETEYAVLLSNLLAFHDCPAKSLEGAALSSVVPGLTPVLRAAVGLLADLPVLVVGPGVKTGLDIRIDNPGELAGDLVCTAVGAMEHYPLPAIIIDLGTATKITVVDERPRRRRFARGADQKRLAAARRLARFQNQTDLRRYHRRNALREHPRRRLDARRDDRPLLRGDRRGQNGCRLRRPRADGDPALPPPDHPRRGPAALRSARRLPQKPLNRREIPPLFSHLPTAPRGRCG